MTTLKSEMATKSELATPRSEMATETISLRDNIKERFDSINGRFESGDRRFDSLAAEIELLRSEFKSRSDKPRQDKDELYKTVSTVFDFLVSRYIMYGCCYIIIVMAIWLYGYCTGGF